MPPSAASRATLPLQDERWLGAGAIDEIVQSHRARAEINGIPFAVLHFELTGSTEARIHRAQAVTQACNRRWAHAHYLGSWSDDLACIVLPNATLEQATQYAEQLLEETHPEAIELYSHEVLEPQTASDQLTVRPVWELFGRPLPRWKRAVDLVVGSALLVGSAPLLLVLMALIRLTSRGPAMFRQARVGIGGKHFEMLKLRTMFADAEEQRDALLARNEQSGAAFKIKDDPRVTPLGQLLRRSSLDELPQLLNVVKGDMSLVGPRPLPVVDWEPTDARHLWRHDVTPGITCTWQVSGRAEIPFDEWMEMDVNYAAHTTFLGDLVILTKTIAAVLTGKGAM